MANENTLPPLYDKIWLKRTFSRVMGSFTMLLFLSLLAYRAFTFDKYDFYPCLLAFLCESSFSFVWLLTITAKWTPSHTITYLDRLLSRVAEAELPPVDLFVTTADPDLEPPIITVNTVLSLLALDYPSNKLACYVSDDACSPLNLYALVEASKFAKLWIPFCKKYNVQVRAPFRYFSPETTPDNVEELEFKQEWLKLKGEYWHLCRKIKNATKKSIVLDGEFAVFSTTQRKDHPTIMKVIWENKEGDLDGVPHLIYVSREKRPHHPHHYKAGAMNVLTRVSGVMTNAPFILNVDCDMYVNNPKIVLHAMCVLLDPKAEKEIAFAQFPQQFYDGLKDDPFGNQLVSIFVYIGAGVAGIQGIFYVGTNCFHRRKVMYGLSPYDHDTLNGQLSGKEDKVFGPSKRFVELAKQSLKGKMFKPNGNLCDSLEAATEVASCEYEDGTAWGNRVGWMYGAMAEDMLTGLRIHKSGWRSEMCGPDPMAFMGCSPQDSIVQMVQWRRWGSGLLEIFLSKHCPIFGVLFGKLQLRQCLAYMWILCWALRSIPEVSYAALMAYCIITNSTCFPKGHAMLIPTVLVVVYHFSDLVESLKTGLSFKTWWNNQRMRRIATMSPWLFAFMDIVIKRLGISDTVFDVTKKEQPFSTDEEGCLDKEEDHGRFVFNNSLVYLPGATILLVQLTALFVYLFGLQPKGKIGNECGVGEVLCSAYVVVCHWQFLKGLFGKGKYGIPFSTIWKSMVLSFLFVYFSRRSAIVD